MFAWFPSYYFLRSYLALAVGILVLALALDGLLVWLTPVQATPNAITYGPDLVLMSDLLTTTANGDASDQATLHEHFIRRQAQFEQTLGTTVSLYTTDDVGDRKSVV